MLRRLYAPALALIVSAVVTPGWVAASPIEITGSGTFAASVSTTSVTAPNATYAFSFFVDNPLTALVDSSGDRIGVPVLSGSYLLNGATVSPTLTTADFFVPSFWGLFSLNFSNGAIASFYGAQIFNNSGALIPGTYASMTSSLNATGPGTVTVGATANAVPEPGLVVLAASGLPVALGFWLKRRRMAVAA